MKKVFFSFDRNPVGIILRAFASKESQLPERIAMVKVAIDKALGICDSVDESRLVFTKITVIVPSDKRYPSHDCGKMAKMLREVYASKLGKRGLEIIETTGDIFCSALNTALSKQAAQGIDYAFIVSPDAHSYLTDSNVHSMLEQAEKGARVVGLAIDELRESIHEGRIANTFALWHIESLQEVGAFNIPLSGEPKSIEEAGVVTVFEDNSLVKPVLYKINGVEEIIPLLLMLDRFHEEGPFIGVANPLEDGKGQYTMVSDPDVVARHKAKMMTKTIRQSIQAHAIKRDLGSLRFAVMK